MKISEPWLRQWVNPPIDSASLCHQLTMAGLEVDSFEPVAPAFSNVVVAEVLAVAAHPDADRLRVCQVKVAPSEIIQIVCGAPNVRVGMKVAAALVGAYLPGNLNINQGKLRGVDSHGMLCGASELGLVDNSDGLLELAADAPVGKDLRVYLDLDAQIIDISITPNRGDCFSVIGLAREIAVANALPLPPLNTPHISCSDNPPLSVSVATPSQCPRYITRTINGINPATPTPAFMRQALSQCGLRCHSFIVDVTNYVLLETGQPLHAFDAAKLQGGLQVRLAKPDEAITLLNGQTINLQADCLVISDDHQAQALAGIMGNQHSSVSASTVDVVLEAAHFAPLAIAGRARRFGLHTDASQRFERGVDFNMPLHAIERASALILQHAGGLASPLNTAESLTNLPQRQPFSVTLASITQRLGFAISSTHMLDILQRLNIAAELHNDTLNIVAPSHRYDIAIAEDISEEIARVYGYDNIPTRMPSFAMHLGAQQDHVPTQALKERLLAMGYQEAISFSFADPKVVAALKLENALKLANPISSELSVMRPSLLASLLPCVVYNISRQQPRVRLFETGLRFANQQSISNLGQIPTLCIVATGKQLPVNWNGQNAAVDFYSFKAEVDIVLSNAQGDITTTRSQNPWLHPGMGADIVHNNQKIGYYGRLHPQVATQLELPDTWVCEIDIAVLTRPVHYTISPLSKFPAVQRDIAVIVDSNCSAQQLVGVAKHAAGDGIIKVAVFDVYTGTGIDTGRKSMALALTWQHLQRTLEEDEIKTNMHNVITQLAAQLGAQLRTI